MDLSSLSRPAVLCQCARCSSSLGVLENEWAQISNSYSIVTGWLSVNLSRITVSTQKKQVPQSSDLSLLRGRILQEIACRLCQQKLGVLSELESGPNIFWKSAKVSFREIVTMRTIEPTFKDGTLERLFLPPPPTTTGPQTELVLSGGPLADGSQSMQRQIPKQGHGIDQISSSVNDLHDAMAELKRAFTALRIELNSPNARLSAELETMGNNNFEMVATVLKELKSKADEIERLKLEIEALKFKNRFIEEHQQQQTYQDSHLMEFQSPGLLQAGRKRPWSDSSPTGCTQPLAISAEAENIAEEGDIPDELSLLERQAPPVKVPLREPGPTPTTDSSDAMVLDHSRPDSPMPRIEVSRGAQKKPQIDDGSGAPGQQSQHHETSVAKRRRLSHGAADATQPSQTNRKTERRKSGRIRKSFSQSSKPDISQPPRSAPLSEQNGNVQVGNGAQQDLSPPTAPTTGPAIPNGTSSNDAATGIKAQLPSRTRSLRGRSRPSTASTAAGSNAEELVEDAEDGGVGPKPDATRILNEAADAESAPPPAKETTARSRTVHASMPEKENAAEDDMASDQENHQAGDAVGRETRRAQLAARDALAKLAMQREEAMMEREEFR